MAPNKDNIKNNNKKFFSVDEIVNKTAAEVEKELQKRRREKLDKEEEEIGGAAAVVVKNEEETEGAANNNQQQEQDLQQRNNDAVNAALALTQNELYSLFSDGAPPLRSRRSTFTDHAPRRTPAPRPPTVASAPNANIASFRLRDTTRYDIAVAALPDQLQHIHRCVAQRNGGRWAEIKLYHYPASVARAIMEYILDGTVPIVHARAVGHIGFMSYVGGILQAAREFWLDDLAELAAAALKDLCRLGDYDRLYYLADDVGLFDLMNFANSNRTPPRARFLRSVFLPLAGHEDDLVAVHCSANGRTAVTASASALASASRRLSDLVDLAFYEAAQLGIRIPRVSLVGFPVSTTMKLLSYLHGLDSAESILNSTTDMGDVLNVLRACHEVGMGGSALADAAVHRVLDLVGLASDGKYHFNPVVDASEEARAERREMSAADALLFVLGMPEAGEQLIVPLFNFMLCYSNAMVELGYLIGDDTELTVTMELMWEASTMSSERLKRAEEERRLQRQYEEWSGADQGAAPVAVLPNEQDLLDQEEEGEDGRQQG